MADETTVGQQRTLEDDSFAARSSSSAQPECRQVRVIAAWLPAWLAECDPLLASIGIVMSTR